MLNSLNKFQSQIANSIVPVEMESWRGRYPIDHHSTRLQLEEAWYLGDWMLVT